MNESVAWQCTSTTYQLNILPASADDDNTTLITIGPPLSNDSILYGDQVPNIPPVKLLTVGDAAANDALAYHFRTTYNRIVLLEENDFALAKKRQAQPLTKRSVILPGHSLWQCAFNETRIEGYIYAGKPTTTNLTNMGDGKVNVTSTVRLPTLPYVVKLIEGKFSRYNVTAVTNLT